MSGPRPGQDPRYVPLRALCALAVMLFHYGTTCTEQGLAGFSDRLVAYANGTWGEMASLMFLMLSGAVLALRYPAGQFSPAAFYKKRWLSLYPMYYLAYGLAAAWLLVFYPGYFGNASPFKLLLSALGMDGYLAYRWAGSYILGEWFLGAIVLLYLLYPLLAWALAHRLPRAALTLVLPVAFVLVVRHGWFLVYYAIYSLHNLFTCLLCFWLGMLYQRYHARWPRLFWGLCPAAAAVLALTLTLRLPFNSFYFMLVDAACLFLLLAQLGPRLMAFGPLAAALAWVGQNSYALLLVHHVLFQQGLVRALGTLAPTLPGCLLGAGAALGLARGFRFFYQQLCRLGHALRQHCAKRCL